MPVWEPDFDEAVKQGIDPFDQAIRANDQASKCHQRCGKLAGLRRLVDCDAACKALEAKAAWFEKMADALSKAIGPNVRDWAPGQDHSDNVYGETYMGQNGKSRADLEAAIDALLKDIHTQGLTPARRAQLDALVDLRNGFPYNPPFYDPGAFHPPVNPPPEQPDT